MRHFLPLLAPILFLAACGVGGTGNGGNSQNAGSLGIGDIVEIVGNEGYRDYERPDGTFDRDDYRRINMEVCRRALNDPEGPAPPEVAEDFCTCIVDHLLMADDDQLRAIRSDREYGDRAHGIVMRACTPVLEGLPPDPLVAPEDEAGGAG